MSGSLFVRGIFLLSQYMETINKSPNENIFVLLQTLNSALEVTPDDLMEKLVATLDGANRIFVTGVGRSGLVARLFANRLMQCGYKVFIVGELVTPGVKEGDLLLVISGSGGTSTLLPLVDKAKSLGAKVAVVSLKTDSPMAKVADLVVAIGSKDPSVFTKASGMPMGTIFGGTIFEFSALIFLEATILYMFREKGLTEEGMRALHANME